MSDTAVTQDADGDVPLLAEADDDLPTARSASLERVAGWLMLLGGPVGLLAAFTLTVEKIELIKNPDYVPSCNFSPILACGSVMGSQQASAFGFPNSLLGLIGFTIVTLLGALVVARVSLPTWVWAGLQAGVLFGIGFIHWLMFQSLERIGALCPYCMVVWSVTMPMAWYVTMRNLSVWSDGRRGAAATTARTIAGSAGVLLTAWFVVVIAVIFWRFHDYWLSLL